LFINFSLFANNEIALITKSKGIVDYKSNQSDVFIKDIKNGLELYNDDLLKTGEDGFVMFVYLDDGSLVIATNSSSNPVGRTRTIRNKKRAAKKLANVNMVINRGIASAERVFSILDNKESYNDDGTIDITKFEDKISFKNVNFKSRRH